MDIAGNKLFKLLSGELTLKQLREIEDEALFLPVDAKTQGVVRDLFQKIEKKREVLLDREVRKIEGDDTAAKIDRLQLLRLSEDVSEEMDQLLVTASLDASQSLLEELEFATRYPISDELKDDSVHSNFASRIRYLADQILEQNSLKPFEELNEVQKREVMRRVR